MTIKPAIRGSALVLLSLVSLLSLQQQALARPLVIQGRHQDDGTVRVLAVGDSITQGSVPSKNLNHPYTIELQKELQQAFPSKKIDVDNKSEWVMSC
jgi:hypothetical protein